MMSQAKGTGLVGYNVQAAVDAKHHLIVAHEVTNVGSDRAQLSKMALAAREAMGKKQLQAYRRPRLLQRPGDQGLRTTLASQAFVPKPMTSNAKAEGRFDKADFIYIARDDEYQCPAGERAIYRFTREENGLQIRRYWSSACPRCPMKAQCTPSDYRRISRWEHEAGARGDAAPARPQARRDDAATTHRRARLRHAQALDGFDALPDAKARARRAPK